MLWEGRGGGRVSGGDLTLAAVGLFSRPSESARRDTRRAREGPVSCLTSPPVAGADFPTPPNEELRDDPHLAPDAVRTSPSSQIH